jgi:hypothetical protein
MMEKHPREAPPADALCEMLLHLDVGDQALQRETAQSELFLWSKLLTWHFICGFSCRAIPGKKDLALIC